MININDIPSFDESQKLPKSVRIETYISEMFDVKKNAQSDEVEIIRKDNNKHISIYDLLRELRNTNLPTSEAHLNELFKSDFIPEYNPLLEYVLSLKKKWSLNKKSEISKLCSFIKVTDFEDKMFNYQDRLEYILKKWLVSMIACIAENKPNEVMFTLVSDGVQGVGKSYLLRSFSNEMFERIDSVDDFLKDIRNLPRASAIFPFIFYDEMVGLKNTSDLAIFKAVISKPAVNIVKNRRKTKVNRIASFMASADASDFLCDPAGSRRYGIVQVDKIDFKGYTSKVDFELILAEAAFLYFAGIERFDYIFNDVDFRNFEKYNRRYIKQTNEMFWIKKLFEVCEENDIEAEYFTSTQILDYLITNGIPAQLQNTLNPAKIGNTMKLAGFQQFQGKRIKGYKNPVSKCYLLKIKTNGEKETNN